MTDAAQLGEVAGVARPRRPFSGFLNAARSRLSVNAWAALVLPLLVFLIVFFAYPAVVILVRSFTNFLPPDHAGLDNYRWFFDTPTNLVVLKRTLIAGAGVAAICLLFGYPYAYLMTLVSARTRMIMLGIVIIAGFTSFMVRNYAWLVILQDNGPINNALHALGLGRIEFIGTTTGVYIAYAQILLPLMILPLYATMRGIDRRLMKAAANLGASPLSRFFTVYLPLSVPGVLAGSLLVFVLTLGFYVTPNLIGSPTHALFSQLMTIQISQLLAWGHAGAMAVVLVAVTFLILGVFALLARRWRVPEQEAGDLGLVEEDTPDGLTLGRGALNAVGVLVAIWLIAPMLIVFPQSFAGIRTLEFPPPSWSTQWYHNLFTNPEWSDTMVRSIEVAVLVTIISVVLGTLAALGLVRGRFPGKVLVSSLIATPLIMPLVVFAIGTYALFLRWHITGSLEGFVPAHTALAVPFVVVLVTVGLRTFDERLEAAAVSLGASRVRAMLTVTLPLLMPSILTGALFAFLTSFDEILTSFFISTATVSTLPVQMYSSVIRGVDPTMAAAASVILVATALLMGVVALIRLRGRRYA